MRESLAKVFDGERPRKSVELSSRIFPLPSLDGAAAADDEKEATVREAPKKRDREWTEIVDRKGDGPSSFGETDESEEVESDSEDDEETEEEWVERAGEVQVIIEQNLPRERLVKKSGKRMEREGERESGEGKGKKDRSSDAFSLCEEKDEESKVDALERRGESCHEIVEGRVPLGRREEGEGRRGRARSDREGEPTVTQEKDNENEEQTREKVAEEGQLQCSSDVLEEEGARAPERNGGRGKKAGRKKVRGAVFVGCFASFFLALSKEARYTVRRYSNLPLKIWLFLLFVNAATAIGPVIMGKKTAAKKGKKGNRGERKKKTNGKKNN